MSSEFMLMDTETISYIIRYLINENIRKDRTIINLMKATGIDESIDVMKKEGYIIKNEQRT